MVETLETAINPEMENIGSVQNELPIESKAIKLNYANIISKPIKLEYSLYSQEGVPMIITNEWTMEYLPDSKVFYFHDGGKYYFDAETGNYLGETKPRLNKKTNTYIKNPKMLTGEVVNKFVQIHDTLVRSITDVGIKAKKAGYFKGDICNECAGFLGKMRSEQSNISYYLLENAFNNYSEGIQWGSEPIIKTEEVELYKGEAEEENRFGILLKGKYFDKRKKTIVPLFASNPIKYNLEDVKIVLEKEIGEGCADIQSASIISPVTLDKLLSKFKANIKEEERKKILTEIMVSQYKKGREYMNDLAEESPKLAQDKLDEYEKSYNLFRQKPSLNLLKSLLVVDNCREIVEERTTEKKTYSSKNKKKGQVLTGVQEGFKDCLNEMQEIFKNRKKITE